MCHVLAGKSNNFYSFHKHKVNTADAPTRQEMISLIKNIAKFSESTCGSKRIKKVLNTLNFKVSQHKTAQLKKEANIWVRYKKKYKVTTNITKTFIKMNENNTIRLKTSKKSYQLLKYHLTFL